jgi:parvulin-like peptidyl-prolyl isomerase
MKNAVLSREVDAKIFYGLSNEELQKYFKAHPDKFTKPEAVKLSEIFLSLAGKNPAEVEARAKQLVAQARAGGDFGELAAANSERMDQNQQRVALQSKGAVGTFETSNLREDIASAIKNVKAGGTSDPIKSDEGYQIIHVDERSAGSTAPEFNENKVREAILAERAGKERDAYLQKLRDEAYIKVADQYASGVMPLLKISSPTTAAVTGTTTATPAKNEKKSKNE